MLMNPLQTGHVNKRHNILLGLQGTAVRTVMRQRMWSGTFHFM